MRALAFETIEQFDQIARETLVSERLVERRIRFAMSANVGTNHAKIACEIRNPRIEPQRTAHPGMNQNHVLRFFPRIGEIVDEIMQLGAVARMPEIIG